MSGVLSTLQVHSCLANFDATGNHHLGMESNDTHPADLLNIPKFIYI